jgi:class 3 adenylate cyclase
VSFLETVERARDLLQRNQRVSLRALRREFELDDETLDELCEELVDVQRVASREGDVLVWAAAAPDAPEPPATPEAPSERAPLAYTPKHLADKILRSKSALEGERKQVTVLFADVKGSMELAGQLDPEQWHAILDRFFQILSEGVHRFEGTVNQYTGDGIMALFGAPIAHEDHAQRACYAALHLQGEIGRYATEVKREHGVGFQARMGLHSGEVVVGKIGDDLRMDYTAQGHTVGLAQRMEGLAEPNTCYMTAATAALAGFYFDLEDLGEFRVKGVAEPVQVHRLAGLGSATTRFDVSRARGLSRFVGRAADLRTLEDALEQTHAGNGQAVGVVAEAGTGKSRLCFEFLERCRARGMRTFEGHAVAHGKNIPLLPVLEVFRAYFGITAEDDDRAAREKIAGRMVVLDQKFADALPLLFDFLGVPDPAHPAPPLDPEVRQRQILGVMRQVTQTLSEQHPTITLIEDLHWMDEASEEFVAHMVDARGGSRNLLLLNFRPEYHADWMQKSWYRQIPLTPLGKDAIGELLEDLLGPDPSIAALAEPIHARTGGNPFFAEEVAQTLIESGHLEGERGAYRLVTPIERLEVPATVHALLAARIDRLAEREKQVLQAAAVIGKEFKEPLLAEVLRQIDSVAAVSALPEALRTLKDSEFVHEQAIYPVTEYGFKHPLTQEVAVHSQLTERRKRTHAAVAVALEAEHAEQLDEAAALLAHHHEEAGNAATAARWHQRAAEWVGRSDIQAALQHWQRVRALAHEIGDERESTSLTVKACTQAFALGGWRVGGSADEWTAMFEEGCRAAERAADRAALIVLHTNYSAVRGLTHANGPDYLHHAREAARIAEQTGDESLRCGTLAYLTASLCWNGCLEEAEKVATQVIELAGGDPHLGAEVAGFTPALGVTFMRAHAKGFRHDPEAALRDLAHMRPIAIESGYPEQTLWSFFQEAELRYALDRWDDSLDLTRSVLRLAENQAVSSDLLARGTLCAELACGRDWQGLLEAAKEGLELLRESSVLRLHESTFLAHIGTAQIGLGRPKEARAAAEEGVAFLREARGYWRPNVYAVLARAQLALGERAPDIAATLDEYEALLSRSGFHLYEGELYELRARLADREAQPEQRASALASAHEAYARFGMSAHSKRLVEELPA